MKSMSTNKAFWRAWLEGNPEKNGQVQTSDGNISNITDTLEPDALEEGLKDLTWLESGRAAGQAAVKRFRKKTGESFGEEIGNTVTHGVMALFMLGMLPFASIRAFTHAAAGEEALDAFGVSIFIISVFFMFLASTIYHSMAPGTAHKSVMNRIDHIMIYVAIAGTYTPICLSVIGGTLGLVLCIAQWCFVIAGALFKSLAFSKSTRSYIITISIYLLMGWMVMLCMPALISGTTAPAFWLIVAGGICYTSGVVSFSMKFPFAHMVWHFLVDFGALCHFIAIVFFM